MPVIAPNLRLLSATVTIGTDEYTGHIQDYKFTPTVASTEVVDVSGKTTKFAGKAGYDLDLTLFQDFTPTGLARKFFTDEGSTAVIKIVEGPTTWTATITLVAPDIGGTPNNVGTAAVKCPSTKPVPTVTA